MSTDVLHAHKLRWDGISRSISSCLKLEDSPSPHPMLVLHLLVQWDTPENFFLYYTILIFLRSCQSILCTLLFNNVLAFKSTGFLFQSTIQIEHVLQIRLIFVVQPAGSPKSHTIYKELGTIVLYWRSRLVYLHSPNQECIGCFLFLKLPVGLGWPDTSSTIAIIQISI